MKHQETGATLPDMAHLAKDFGGVFRALVDLQCTNAPHTPRREILKTVLQDTSIVADRSLVPQDAINTRVYRIRTNEMPMTAEDYVAIAKNIDLAKLSRRSEHTPKGLSLAQHYFMAACDNLAQRNLGKVITSDIHPMLEGMLARATQEGLLSRPERDALSDLLISATEQKKSGFAARLITHRESSSHSPGL